MSGTSDAAKMRVFPRNKLQAARRSANPANVLAGYETTKGFFDEMAATRELTRPHFSKFRDLLSGVSAEDFERFEDVLSINC